MKHVKKLHDTVIKMISFSESVTLVQSKLLKKLKNNGNDK